MAVVFHRTGRRRLPPIYVRVHRLTARRDGHARKSVLQYGDDSAGRWAQPRERLRRMATAVPRHGAHRHAAPTPVRRLPLHHDVATSLPPAARTLAQALTAFRGTTTAAPNFALDLCTRKVTDAQRSSLDLSSVTQLFDGAEPIDAGALDRFVDRFHSVGFRREAIFPCYGLAEGTLIVSGGEHGKGPRALDVDSMALERGQARPRAEGDTSEAPWVRLVSCGRAFEGATVAIVDTADSRLVEPNVVGEICVQSSSVAKGYWGDDLQSDAVFKAPIAGAVGSFLRTGDLGFLGQDGDLYVTGRAKDVIIVRGRNLYPQDIERTVEGVHSAVRPGCVAAFATRAGSTESAVVVAEVECRPGTGTVLDLVAVRQAIIQTVAEEHAIRLSDVVLIRPRTIPKTTSGKIQRRACMDAYESKRLAYVDEPKPEPRKSISRDPFNPFLPEFHADPYPHYQRIRGSRRCTRASWGAGY